MITLTIEPSLNSYEFYVNGKEVNLIESSIYPEIVKFEGEILNSFEEHCFRAYVTGLAELKAEKLKK